MFLVNYQFLRLYFSRKWEAQDGWTNRQVHCTANEIDRLLLITRSVVHGENTSEVYNFYTQLYLAMVRVTWKFRNGIYFRQNRSTGFSLPGVEMISVIVQVFRNDFPKYFRRYRQNCYGSVRTPWHRMRTRDKKTHVDSKFYYSYCFCYYYWVQS